MTQRIKREGRTQEREELPAAKNSAPKEARIQSAIAKGKQTLLPCEANGQNLSKFEHNGRDGPVMVYAEEAFYKHNKYGHYKVIMALKPAESVRNQLFFGNESPKQNKEVLMKSGSSRVAAKQVASTTGAHSDGRFVDRKGKRQPKKPPKPASSQDSFEELIERYKTRRVKYKDLMGTGHGHVEVLDKLDGMYRQRKQERLTLVTQFSNLGEIRTEINTSTGLRDHAVDLEEAGKEPKEPLKLPKIRVSTVSELTKKDSRRNLDRKRLVVPKERTGALKLGAQKLDLNDLTKLNDSPNYEKNTLSLRLPEL